MRRRTFLAALPAAAAFPFASRYMGAAEQHETAGPGQGGAVHSGTETKFQAPGQERFERPDVHAGDRPSGASWTTRSPALGTQGAAGTAHPLATQTAIEILKKGGSAADAAVAANAMLGLVEPTSAGLGGDCYAFVWDPKAKRLEGMASSGASPRGLSLATVRSRARTVDGRKVLPTLGAVTVSVPGALAGWWSLHQRFGKLPWAELFEPAIHYAQNGVVVPQIIGWYIKRNLAAFVRPNSGVEETANAMHTYAPGGVAPNEGQVFRNPDLAHTYQQIAQGGRDAFYNGPIADTIEAYFKRIGGWMTRADLAAMQPEWPTPLETTYRGVTVYAMGANTQGLATLQMLSMIEHFDMRGYGFQSPESLQVQIEAKRLAYEDRARFYADPHFSKVPVEWLNSKAYAAERAKLIDPRKILTPVYPGQAPSHGDTTYFTVADADGMMVSQIQSNFRGMGSGLVADGLGFMFQDRGELFSLQDGHPNLYAPGKRPFQTIIPGFAARDGVPWMSFGVMGGDMQPQGQAQIIINRVDYGLDVQAAGDSPRWHHEGSSQTMGEDPAGLGPKGMLKLERGVPQATQEALKNLGWTLGPTDGGFGRYECIEHSLSHFNGHEDRVYSAASEMRADGVALAY